MIRMSTLSDAVGKPEFLRGFHRWMTLIWFLLIIPTILLWRESIVWIALMSAWANFAGHFSSWQAARIEVKQEHPMG